MQRDTHDHGIQQVIKPAPPHRCHCFLATLEMALHDRWNGLQHLQRGSVKVVSARNLSTFKQDRVTANSRSMVAISLAPCSRFNRSR